MMGGFKFAFDFALGASGNVTAGPSYNAVQWLFSSEKTLAQNLSGTSVTDWSQYAGTARAVQPGRGLTFDGVNAYFAAPSPLAAGTIDAGGIPQPVTFSCWIKPTVSTAFRIYAPLDVGSALFTLNASAQLALTYYGGGATTIQRGIYSSSGLSNNTVYHVAVTYDGTSLSAATAANFAVYVNGASVAKTLQSLGTWGSSTVSNSSHSIGRLAAFATSNANGTMWDFRIYNRVLSADDILSLYQEPETAATDFSVRFPMSAGSGTTSYDTGPSAFHGAHSGGVTHTTFTDGSGSDSNNQLGYSVGVNLLAFSEQFDLWTKTTSAVTPNTTDTTDPLGTNTAGKIAYLAPEARVTQNVVIASTANIAYSVYLKSGSGNGSRLFIYNNTRLGGVGGLTIANIASGGVSVGDGWYRHTLVVTPTSLTGYAAGDTLIFYVYTDSSSGAIPGSYVYAWGAQAEYASAATAYQQTLAANNVGAFIPARNATLDANGNALQFTGRVPYTATIAGHDGSTNGFHSGCTLTLNPVGAPQLSPLYGVAWVYGAALPSGVSADFDGATYTNIRYG